ncbi:MAG: malto-oligosyltrehalose synthase, partial [Janthinobacterium lividum]
MNTPNQTADGNPHSVSNGSTDAAPATLSNMPRATARLQFHRDFTLDDAVDVVDYYHALGISHLYASPILTAKMGSTHGYDIADPTRVNPELGGEAALKRLVAKLRSVGMGLIVDIVPNHMSAGPENPWWQDVFEFGADSRYAAWFDIDWLPSDTALKGKILAPYLGQPYGEALRSGDLTLQRDDENGKLYLHYFSHRFPLAPYTYADVLRGGDQQQDLARYACSSEEGVQAMHELLERQHYRLTWWRNAAEEINWRRFFEVSDLAGVRVEQEDVFDAVHEHVFRMYAQGLIDGVRVDHVDGLAQPAAYCLRLRQRLTELSASRPQGVPRDQPYIVLEKILESDEQLRDDWQVDGTTGYDFMNQAGALLHAPDGAAALTAMWQSITGDTDDFATHVKLARAQLLEQNFVGELDSLSRYLLALAREDMATRDFSLAAIR